MTAGGGAGHGPVRPGREAALEAENVRLRAALARAGLDADRLVAETAAARDELRQARGDATGAAAGHAREAETGRAGLAGAEALDEELRRANAALGASRAAPAVSEARLRDAFAIETVGVMFWGPGFGLVEANDAFLAMTGFTRGEALGKTWQELTPEEFHPPSLRAIAEVAARGETTPYEKQYYRKDGSRWWGLFAARQVGDGVVEFVLDVTARREAEAALRESEARFRHMADSAPALIWMTDAEGRVTFANMHYDHVFGRPAAEMLGGGWAGVVLPEDLERHTAAFSAAFRARAPFRTETRVRDKDGRVRWLRCEGVPRLDGAGAFLGYTGCNVDITEARLAAEELEARVEERTAELRQAVTTLHEEVLERERAEDALRQSQKMEAVGQLTGGIAHDFNNLLTVVRGSLELMQRRVDQGRIGELGRYLEPARQAVHRAANLTQRLLGFARRQALDAKPVVVDELVEGMAELVRRTVGPGIAVEARLADGDWTVLCDANQLENALLNLAINARDAMPDGGTLTLATREVHLSAADVAGQDGVGPGEYVELCVSDTGAGMTPEVMARAFEPFFTTKPIGQGTGLGLSQLYGFVRQSGGLVRLDSAPGRGTTVRLYMPRQRGGETAAAAEASGQVEARAGAGGTVLLVEDEAAVRALAAEGLRERGHRVLEARDGPAALRLLAAARVDLLVTDVGLPGGMNGRQLAEAARERRPDLPVLFITGYAGAALDGRLAPGMEVIGKPFTLDALAAKSRDLMMGQG